MSLASISPSKRTKITVEEIDIEPHNAVAFLTKNVHNRPVSATTVRKYARDMKEGNWKVTADCIRFDTEGNLIDGQHRLRACVMAGTGFRSFVAYSLPPDSKDAIDGALMRRPKDILAMEGYRNVKKTIAALRWVAAYRLQHTKINNDGSNLSTTEIKAMLKHHKGIEVSVVKSLGVVGPSQTRVAAIHHLATAYQNGGDKADAFVEVFKSGVPSRENCPAHQLREFFIKHKTERTVVGKGPHTRLLVRSWNAFVTDETLKRIYDPKKFVDMVGLDVEDVWIPPAMLKQAEKSE